MKQKLLLRRIGIIFIIVLFLIITKSLGVETVSEDNASELSENTYSYNTIEITPNDYYEYKEKLYSQYSNSIRRYNRNNKLSFEEYIVRETRKGISNIDVSDYELNVENIKSIVMKLYEQDELFYLTGKYGYSYVPSGNIKTLQVFYNMEVSEIENAWNAINLEAEKYKSGIRKEWGDLEKVLYTNDYLCRLCQYDSTISEKSHTLYGALVTKRPVCDGYSHAFKYLLKQVGVEAKIVTSNEMEHAWNLVKIDGNYYHIDVTWNDPVDFPGVGRTVYSYFLASDNKFLTQKKHYGWATDVTATSTKYDSVNWNEIYNYLVYKDNYWYYVTQTTINKIILKKMNLRNNMPETETINNIITNSPVQAGLTSDGNNLYFSAMRSIYKMDSMGKNIETIFTLSDNSKYVYAIEIIDDIFYYDTIEITNDYLKTRKTSILEASIDGITLNQMELSINRGTTQMLLATINPSYATQSKMIKWTSDNPSVATVDSNGKVTALSIGTAKITAITSNGKTATCAITVTKPKLILGDADLNEKITTKDAKMILQHIVKKITLTEDQLKNADTSKDNRITTKDAKMILQHIVKKIVLE